MTPSSSIQYLTRSQVDDNKWNACVEKAGNGLVYAYTIYLDEMADNWDALVFNDYEAVMPLPWRKKWGFTYLYQPPFCAQLGVFGNGISKKIVTDFLQAVPKKFCYWDIYLNKDNLFTTANYELNERMNFVLPLNKPYEILEKAYRENIRRNVRKAKGYGCTIHKNIAVEKVVQLAKEQSQQADTEEQAFEKFVPLCNTLLTHNQAVCYGVYSLQGQLIASAVFFFSHHRAYYILVGNHANGRTLGASHALINAFIEDYAGENLLLDFEGSDLRNLAFFYSSFGAAIEKYPAVKLNRLPWWIRWLKQ